jgi:hypothetical protein
MEFIMENYKNVVKFNQQKEVMRLIIPNNFLQRDGKPETPEKILEFLIKFCKEVKDMFGNKSTKEAMADV